MHSRYIYNFLGFILLIIRLIGLFWLMSFILLLPNIKNIKIYYVQTLKSKPTFYEKTLLQVLKNYFYKITHFFKLIFFFCWSKDAMTFFLSYALLHKFNLNKFSAQHYITFLVINISMFFLASWKKFHIILDRNKLKPHSLT